MGHWRKPERVEKAGGRGMGSYKEVEVRDGRV